MSLLLGNTHLFLEIKGLMFAITVKKFRKKEEEGENDETKMVKSVSFVFGHSLYYFCTFFVMKGEQVETQRQWVQTTF